MAQKNKNKQNDTYMIQSSYNAFIAKQLLTYTFNNAEQH